METVMVVAAAVTVMVSRRVGGAGLAVEVDVAGANSAFQFFDPSLDLVL